MINLWHKLKLWLKEDEEEEKRQSYKNYLINNGKYDK
jgi:hypothetical protein